MAKKYYAIKQGLNLKTNELVTNEIFNSWAEASPLVNGINKKEHGIKVEYKSFTTMKAAQDYLQDYLNEGTPFLIKSEDTYPKDCPHYYIDGSFSKELRNYSFGLVCVENNSVVLTKNGEGRNKEAVVMQQIAGELAGAMNALFHAKNKGWKKIVIFFDYEGVVRHAVGNWKRDNAFNETYYQWMQSFFKNNPDMEIVFCKVDAHTGDDFNELADGFAKLALNINPDNIFYRMVERYGISINSRVIA